MSMFNSSIYRIMEWITRFAYINLLWIGFSISGLLIFGFFPSTFAMFAIIRDWIQGKTDIPVFTSYWNYFKTDFLKSNLLGIFILAICLIIAVDIFYIKTNMNEGMSWTYIPLFAFMLLFLFLLFFLFPAFVHYDLKLTRLVKNAFLIMLISPVHCFLILLCLGTLFFIIKIFPALAFIFGSSFYAFITIWLCLHAFDRIQRKQGN